MTLVAISTMKFCDFHLIVSQLQNVVHAVWSSLSPPPKKRTPVWSTCGVILWSLLAPKRFWQPKSHIWVPFSALICSSILEEWDISLRLSKLNMATTFFLVTSIVIQLNIETVCIFENLCNRDFETALANNSLYIRAI